MFPLNLQKNIQELEKQISLLETECEHMEAEKQDAVLLSGKTNSKPLIRNSSNQPFITGPCGSASLYSSRMSGPLPTGSKIYSVSCSHFRTTGEKFLRGNEAKEIRNSHGFESYSKEKSKETQKLCVNSIPKCSFSGNDDKANGEKREIEQKLDRYVKTCKRSIDSIKEVSESSEDTSPHQVYRPRVRNVSKEILKESTWCELLRESSLPNKWQEWKKNRESPEDFQKCRYSSDEEYRGRDFIQKKSKSNGHWPGKYERPITPPRESLYRRRPRSSRTKKNYVDEIPMDVNITKVLEKEIQCALGDEEKEKEEFFSNLNEAIKILHFLIGELKTKLSREKRNDVLNDMQTTLMKISAIKSVNSPHDLLSSLTSIKGRNLSVLDGAESIIDVKNTLRGLKEFCREMSNEKAALTEELSVKNRAIANYKNKEKEYLSLISSLKYNLEQLKEEADQTAHAKRDLKVMKIKLQEETKVIEALKKSHEKMQELIENYVLENDKLRAEVKITKLESHKFNVLLAGKEVEINKYKKEIEYFQKQITEQLSLLRSKATENEPEQAIDSITNQRNIFQGDVESFTDELDIQLGNNITENLGVTLFASSARTQTKIPNKESTPSMDRVEVISKPEWETESKLSNSSREGQNPEKSTNHISDSKASPKERQFGLEIVLSGSKNLRNSINELLQDIRRENSDMYWLSPSESCMTSSQSILLTSSSEDGSEGGKNN